MMNERGETGSKENEGHLERLQFESLDHEPRIYSAAPSGVLIVKIRAFDLKDPNLVLLYRLQSDPVAPNDCDNFQVGTETGKLTTKRYIDRPVGSVYSVIIVAYVKGESTSEHLKIHVTEYNKYSPVFLSSNYKVNIELMMPVGQAITFVEATDIDDQHYNAEVYYAIQSRTNLIGINSTTGVITLEESLSPRYRDLVFSVIAYDGGSPKRVAKTRLTITIKIISAPRDVIIAQTGDKWAMLCWLPSSNGNPLGYIIYLKYQTDFMISPVAPVPYVTTQHNITREALGKRNDRMCVALTDLETWSDFEARIAGWDSQEIGMISQPVVFDTRVNRSCYNLDNSNFKCSCLVGFYGEDCALYNPCFSSIPPCMNGGTCNSFGNNQYECACPPRFNGKSCEISNPCSQSACENGGQCYNISKSSYGCKCAPGYTGALCETNINECSSDPCQNGGQCVDDEGAFKCICSSGFEGDYCEEEVNECTSWPCSNGGSCVDLFNDFRCNCLPKFTGKTCKILIDVCGSNPCINGGSCVETSYFYQCQCPHGYKGQYCQFKEKCFSETTNSSTGVIIWPEVDFGSTVKLECPNNYKKGGTFKAETHSVAYYILSSVELQSEMSKQPSNGTKQKMYATRSCMLINDSAVWGDPTYDVCIGEDFLAAEKLSQHFENITKFPSQINGYMFIDVAANLQRILPFSLKDRKIAQRMVTIVSNMLEVNDSILEDADKYGNISRDVINIINQFTYEVDLQQHTSVTLNSFNLHINVTSIGPAVNLTDGITFSPSYTKKLSYGFEENISTKSQSTFVKIPLEALRKVGKSLKRIQFVSFKNKKLFRGFGSVALLSKSSDSKGQVIIASIGQISIYNLKNPVVYKMLNLHGNRKVMCVYWDPDGMSWLTNGLKTNVTKDWVECKSTHLTAFSVLLDPQPYLTHSLTSEAPLTLISNVGVILSILGLILTILTYVMFRSLDRNHSGKILVNLCTSMLFMNISFLLLSAKEYTVYTQEDVCLFVAISTHYFVLTTLSWMFVEAINMYQLLITVYVTTESHFMAKRLVLAWGLPMCIVAGTIYNTGFTYYRSSDPDWCLFSPSNMNIYYITYIGPACVIIFTNTIVFVMVNRVLFQRSVDGKHVSIRQGPTAAQVRGSFTVMILLGVTWLPGIFALGNLRLIFQYAFCIANSLQGFIIFIVRCIIPPEVRNAWRLFFRTGRLKSHSNVITGDIYKEHRCTSSSSQQKQGTSLVENNQDWREKRAMSTLEGHRSSNLEQKRQCLECFYSTSTTLPYPKNSHGKTPIIGSCIGRSRSLHIDGCTPKEGENTSWQFMAPVSTIAPTDQGYETAEHSPESPQLQQRHHTSPPHYSASTPEQLHSTSSPLRMMVPTVCTRSDSDLAPQSPTVSLYPHTIFHYSVHRESGSTTTEPQSSSTCSSTPSPSTSSSIPPTLTSYGAQLWNEMPLVNINSSKIIDNIDCEELL